MYSTFLFSREHVFIICSPAATLKHHVETPCPLVGTLALKRRFCQWRLYEILGSLRLVQHCHLFWNLQMRFGGRDGHIACDMQKLLAIVFGINCQDMISKPVPLIRDDMRARTIDRRLFVYVHRVTLSFRCLALLLVHCARCNFGRSKVLF